jgi:hypothetical protein
MLFESGGVMIARGVLADVDASIDTKKADAYGKLSAKTYRAVMSDANRTLTGLIPSPRHEWLTANMDGDRKTTSFGGYLYQNHSTFKYHHAQTYRCYSFLRCDIDSALHRCPYSALVIPCTLSPQGKRRLNAKQVMCLSYFHYAYQPASQNSPLSPGKVFFLFIWIE